MLLVQQTIKEWERASQIKILIILKSDLVIGVELVIRFVEVFTQIDWVSHIFVLKLRLEFLVFWRLNNWFFKTKIILFFNKLWKIYSFRFLNILIRSCFNMFRSICNKSFIQLYFLLCYFLWNFLLIIVWLKWLKIGV